jgi:PleD family two-component response regulator
LNPEAATVESAGAIPIVARKEDILQILAHAPSQPAKYWRKGTMNQFEFPTETVDLTDVLSQRTNHNYKSSPSRASRGRNHVDIPSGLVVSADDKIRGTLGKTLLLCGIAPAFATCLAESRGYLSTRDPGIVVCEHLLPDGRYSELLQLNQQRDNNAPVIVVSRTGDWEDYFAALELGADDFLAYPLIPGELQRIIRSCLAERKPHRALDDPYH